MGTLVTETPVASSGAALRHFEGMLAFETDCWDVHESLRSPKPDFILASVDRPRSQMDMSVNIPHGQLTASRIAEFPKGKLFVVYCAGPHCNGANKAALRLARLGLPVKMMIGGITGWLDEGFSLATQATGSPAPAEP